ncbi:hypothetical protein [Nocardia fluminea]|uniref:hypothetical protein n=1 Tax=Nocardia fluminea TaxID=134984 RepID=UPI003658389A
MARVDHADAVAGTGDTGLDIWQHASIGERAFCPTKTVTSRLGCEWVLIAVTSLRRGLKTRGLLFADEYQTHPPRPSAAYSSEWLSEATRVYDELAQRRITAYIPRRGTRDKVTAGRWNVEQALDLLHQYRRLAVRWERRTDTHQGFLDLAAALICWRRLSNRT